MRATLFGAFFAAVLSTNAAAQATKVRLAYVPVIGAAPVFIAEKAGWAKAAGIDLSLVRFESGPVAINAAVSGTIDALAVGIAPMVGSYLAVAPELVYRAFLISAATFGATSLAGYVTKRDLSGLGAFFMMASIGIIIAILVNAFLVQSTMMSLVTSVITVLLFAGVTAYETQMIKEMYVEGDAPGVAKGKSIFGAFALYGSFITLFVHILNILGIMRSE